jgi:endonuclease/exonuclease/phosphatase family metal-dependent hydrolase
MPMYYRLRWAKGQDKTRIIDNLLALRQQLQTQIPPRTVQNTLLLGTWNLRDFDSNKFGHGPRLQESYYYIAEIISAFDIVALQEVNRDLSALDRLLDILGPAWDFIATDITEGRSGNDERMVFVYDTGKVRFQKVAGEIVLPKSSLISGDQQFARTPFVVKFQSGWFKFDLCSVHLYYGANQGDGYERRIEEIDRIASCLETKANAENINMILLGDMNIVDPEDRTMQALKKYQFVIPEELTLPTNMLQNKYYDQIAFINKRDELELGPSTPNAGVFNPYESVFRAADWKIYYPLGKDNGKWPEELEKQQKYYQYEWRTWQISDHFPLWIELKIDFTEKYLTSLKEII